MKSAAAFTACVMDEFPQKKLFIPGGNSLNFALGCKRYGFEKVSIVGAVGNDSQGLAIRSLVKERGINPERLYIKEGTTARNRIYLHNDGERYSNPEDWNGGVYQDFRLSDNDWDFLFNHDIIATTFIDPNFATFLSRIDKKNCQVSIDFLHSPSPEIIRGIIDKLNVAFISCEQNEIDNYRSLNGEIPIVLLLGKLGSVALIDGKEIHQQALPVSKVIDTTGCGDAFQSAFCCKWFDTFNISDALLAGAESGKTALSVVGGAF